MELIELFSSVEMFEGLNRKQLKRLSEIFKEQVLTKGELLFNLGDRADRLYIVGQGFIEILVGKQGDTSCSPVRNLGFGQTVGEMSWTDRGLRSASARSISDQTVVVSVTFEALDELCQREPKIGYRISRNIAADLSFRLRQETKALEEAGLSLRPSSTQPTEEIGS